MQAILALIELILPQLGTATATVALVEKFIAAITALIPIVVQEYKDLVPIMKSMIAAARNMVSGNSMDPATIAAMLDQLDIAEAQLDADYETAAALAAKEDAEAAAEDEDK
jgi:hypothetical protein